MKRMISKKLTLGALACALVGGLIAAEAYAAHINQSGSVPYYLYGANANGNRSWNKGNFGTAKFAKIPGVHVIWGVAKGKVTNKSGQSQMYWNQGNPVWRPNGNLVPSTSDYQNISRRGGRNRARTSAVLIYSW